ncbi:MAG: P-type conjugative transfer protein TrbG [Sphingomonas sp.]
MSHVLTPACIALVLANPCAAQTAPPIGHPGAAPAAAQTVSAGPAVRPEPAPSRPRRVARPARKRPALLRVDAATRAATREPSALAFINAVQVYPWSDGILYRLYGAPERITDIALQPGEALVAIAAGDTVRWTVGDTTSGSGEARRIHILVKPFAAGLRTNLLITTDRRSYHLQLESTAATAMAAISWVYPETALLVAKRDAAPVMAAPPTPAPASAPGVAPEALRFDYAISGDRPAWRPLRAFDDGRQVYIEFPESLSQGEAPPLFLVDAHGAAQLVNYRLAGRFYVVDRLFEVAELRLGARKQQIVRIARIPSRAPKAGRGS